MLTIVQLLTDHLRLAHMFLLRITCKKIYSIFSHEDILNHLNGKFKSKRRNFLELLDQYGKRGTNQYIKNDDIAAFSVIYPEKERPYYINTRDIKRISPKKYLNLCDKAVEHKAVKIFGYIIHRAVKERNIAAKRKIDYNTLLLDKSLKSCCEQIYLYLFQAISESDESIHNILSEYCLEEDININVLSSYVLIHTDLTKDNGALNIFKKYVGEEYIISQSEALNYTKNMKYFEFLLNQSQHC